MDVFFEETNDCLFVSVDLEASLIDDSKNSTFANLFHPEFLLSVKEYGGNNFANGDYTGGKEIIDNVNDRMRKYVDNYDNVQGGCCKS